ncbi:MAG: hypothetical protein E7324_10525, partial [Clostridiales bacterium]|nr:hypothetical protein [Clostridiales bacterium]
MNNKKTKMIIALVLVVSVALTLVFASQKNTISDTNKQLTYENEQIIAAYDQLVASTEAALAEADQAAIDA